MTTMLHFAFYFRKDKPSPLNK